MPSTNFNGSLKLPDALWSLKRVYRR